MIEKNKLQKILVELENAKSSIFKTKNQITDKLNMINGKEEGLNIEISRINSRDDNNETLDTTYDPLLSTSYKNSLNNTTLNEDLIRSNISRNSNQLEKLENYKKQALEAVKKSELEIENSSTEIVKIKKEFEKVSEKRFEQESELKSILLEISVNSDKKQSIVKKISALGQIKPQYLEELDKKKIELLKKLNNESKDESNLNNINDKTQKLIEPFLRKLALVDQKMKKFEKINRFALEDYKSFKEKSEQVKDRLEDLQIKLDHIYEVINMLDVKKDNAINLTFEKVKNSFTKFFSELVPNGNANLKLEDINMNNTQNQKDTQNNKTQKTQNSKETKKTQNKSNKYNTQNTQFPTQSLSQSKMISISVSFGGNINNLKTMHQLSGGQKTAVAIALIFALSKIDPPPFYILDEIDAALDPTLRNNLSKLINKLSKENQFIISTFKPEIMEAAKNIYQIKFANKTSNFNLVDKEMAKSFIREISSGNVNKQ